MNSPAFTYAFKRGKLMCGYIKPESQSIFSAQPPSMLDMPTMQSYCGLNWAMCAYKSEEDLQAAFNLVAQNVPEALWRLFPSNAGVRWNLLAPDEIENNSAAARGYVSAKWPLLAPKLDL